MRPSRLIGPLRVQHFGKPTTQFCSGFVFPCNGQFGGFGSDLIVDGDKFSACILETRLRRCVVVASFLKDPVAFHDGCYFDYLFVAIRQAIPYVFVKGAFDDNG